IGVAQRVLRGVSAGCHMAQDLSIVLRSPFSRMKFKAHPVTENIAESIRTEIRECGVPWQESLVFEPAFSEDVFGSGIFRMTHRVHAGGADLSRNFHHHL